MKSFCARNTKFSLVSPRLLCTSALNFMLSASQSWGHCTLSGTAKGTRPWGDTEQGQHQALPAASWRIPARRPRPTPAAPPGADGAPPAPPWRWHSRARRRHCPRARWLWHYCPGSHARSPPQAGTASAGRKETGTGCGALPEHRPRAPLACTGTPWPQPSPTPVGTMPTGCPCPAEGTWLAALPSPGRPARCHQH